MNSETDVAKQCYQILQKAAIKCYQIWQKISKKCQNYQIWQKVAKTAKTVKNGKVAKSSQYRLTYLCHKLSRDKNRPK